MKRLLITACALFILTTAGAALASDGIKIASVDLRKVALECRDGVEASKILSKMAETLESTLKAKQTELEKIKDALDGKGKKLTAKERSAKEQELQKKIGQYRELGQNGQKELQAKEQELGSKIMDRIEKIVKEFAPKNGYSLVIRKSDIVYIDEKNDVTAQILKLVDAPPEEAPAKK
jgi:outer membrane protein